MKKELILAIGIGILIGFSGTGLFWAQRQGKLKLDFLNNKQEAGQKESSPTPEEKEPQTETNENTIMTLEIIKPENEIISQSKEITVNGQTTPNAAVAFIWEDGEDIVIADEDGKFEMEIDLIGGENVIEISAYDDSGNVASKNLTITYSTAKL